VLMMYKYPVNNEDEEAVNNIAKDWEKLCEEADKKDQYIDTIKESYQDLTKQQVERFKGELHKYYEDYIRDGPGAEHVTLDEGLVKLEQSIE